MSDGNVVAKNVDELMQEAITAYLIIEQQQEKLKEILSPIADSFGVNLPTTKKILVAYAKDTLDKTSEKMEEERNSLANADTMISAIENLVIEPPEPV